MGTWGPGQFDGDDAYDVIDEFKEFPTMQTVEERLKFVLTPGYDEVEWEYALAAAEIIAIMTGHPAQNPSSRHPEVIALIKQHALTAPQALIDTAVLVCQKALDQSDLRETIRQYSEPQFYEQWIRSVTDLQNRLQSSDA
jgi:hypothetical protein